MLTQQMTYLHSTGERQRKTAARSAKAARRSLDWPGISAILLRGTGQSSQPPARSFLPLTDDVRWPLAPSFA